MADKVYTVIIDGEEYVSKAAQEAGDGLDKFAKKKDGWIKSFVDIKAAWEVVAGAGRALYGVAQESLAAFDEYSSSLRKLEGTAKLTGTPLGELQDLASNAKKEFGLSSVQANEYAAAVNNLSIKAGGAVDKQKLLASVLELGAAKGLDAEASLVAFNQSILGIDEGTDKLFGKNPSGLWADYADQIGKAPGKMNDLDKSLVLVYATMEAGGKVQGSFSTWLESSQGQAALLTNRLQDGKVAFGEILVPVRDVVVKGLNGFIDAVDTGGTALQDIGRVMLLVAKNGIATLQSAWETFGPTVVTVIKATVAGVMFLSDATRALAIFTQEATGQIVKYFGLMVEKGGSILKIFGVEMVAGWGKTMKEWGEKTEVAATTSWTAFREESRAAWGEMGKDAKAAGPVLAEPFDYAAVAAEDAAKKKVAAEKAALAEATDAGKAYVKWQREEQAKTNAAIKATNEAYKFLQQAADQYEKAAIKAFKPEAAERFTAKVEGIRTATDKVIAGFMATLPPVESLLPPVSKIDVVLGKVAKTVQENARGMLDVAGAFGLADEQAQALLTSAINIAEAIPKAIAGDFGSLGGILAASANVMKQLIGGDAERKKLLRDNTTGLTRLAKEVGNLRLGVTGDTFTKVGAALENIVPKLKSDAGKNLGFNVSTLLQGLQGQGLSLSDLEEVGKALGVNVKDSKGNLSFGAVRQLLEAIGLTEFGQFGSSFGDRLDSTTRGFDINGTSGLAQLQQLFGLGADFSPALQGVFDATDLGGTRGRLAGLFQGLVDGTISASQFGGLTGTEFLDLITDLIDRIDGLGTDAGAPSAPSTPGSLPGGEDVPTTGGPVTSPTLTLADVFRDYSTESIPLLSSQLDAQLRIAVATEATAENTALTVDELRALRSAITGGAFVDLIDTALSDRRQAAETNIGTGVVL